MTDPDQAAGSDALAGTPSVAEKKGGLFRRQLSRKRSTNNYNVSTKGRAGSGSKDNAIKALKAPKNRAMSVGVIEVPSSIAANNVG